MPLVLNLFTLQECLDRSGVPDEPDVPDWTAWGWRLYVVKISILSMLVSGLLVGVVPGLVVKWWPGNCSWLLWGLGSLVYSLCIAMVSAIQTMLIDLQWSSVMRGGPMFGISPDVSRNRSVAFGSAIIGQLIIMYLLRHKKRRSVHVENLST
jgi:hypothetical protein